MNYLLVTLHGKDQPGIVPSLMGIIHESKSEIIDLGQSITHGFISLSLLVTQKEKLLDRFTAQAQRWNLKLISSEVDTKRQMNTAHSTYVLSCVSQKNIASPFLSDISNLFSTWGIGLQRIENLSQKGFCSLDIKASSAKEIDLETLKLEFMDLSNKYEIDMAFLQDDIYRYTRRLIVFDMDSTLIKAEVIDEMAAAFGIGEKVKLITEKAMNGEINFDEALKQRVALLKGFPRDDMEKIFDRLPLMPGVEAFIKTVKSLGYRTAVVSGGFRYFAEKLKDKLAIDYAYANELEWQEDRLTGKVLGEIINAQRKAEILEALAQKEQIHLEQVVAIGDGANDLLMLSKAGLGIAFHAKEKVRRESRHQMSHGPMTSILYFLGIREEHHHEVI